MSMKNDIIFDIIESEASLLIFMDREDFKAEGAAIIITGSPIGHKPIMPRDKFTLWFGRGINRESFKTFELASIRAIEIIESATIKITPRIEGRYAKKFNRIKNRHNKDNA